MEWISIEERLPEEEGGYIVYGERWRGYKTVTEGEWTGELFAANAHEVIENVTHWMPLPKPPDETLQEAGKQMQQIGKDLTKHLEGNIEEKSNA